MKIFIYILLLSTIFTLTFNYCSKCRKGKYLGELRFSQTELDVVPYLENESIIFKDSINDSIYFSGMTRSSFYQNRKYLSDEDQEHDECADYYETEKTTIHSQNTYPNLAEINLFFKVENSSQIRKYIFFEIDVFGSTNYEFLGSYPIDNLINYQDSLNSFITFNDSLMLDSNKFYSVFTIKHNSTQNVTQIDNIFYSFNEGIVGFQMAGGKIWHKSN